MGDAAVLHIGGFGGLPPKRLILVFIPVLGYRRTCVYTVAQSWKKGLGLCRETFGERSAERDEGKVFSDLLPKQRLPKEPFCRSESLEWGWLPGAIASVLSP